MCIEPQRDGLFRSHTSRFDALRKEFRAIRCEAAQQAVNTLETAARRASGVSVLLASLGGSLECTKVNWLGGPTCIVCTSPTRSCCHVCGRAHCAACLPTPLALTDSGSPGPRVAVLSVGAEMPKKTIARMQACARCSRALSPRISPSPSISPSSTTATTTNSIDSEPAAIAWRTLEETYTKVSALRGKINRALPAFEAALEELVAEGPRARDLVPRAAKLDSDIAETFARYASSLQAFRGCRGAPPRLLASVLRATVAFYRDAFWTFRNIARALSEVLPPPVRDAIRAAVATRTLTTACALVKQLAIEATLFAELDLAPTLAQVLDTIEKALRARLAADGADATSHFDALRALVRENGQQRPIISMLAGRPADWRVSLARRVDETLCVVLYEVTNRCSEEHVKEACEALIAVRKKIASIMQHGDEWEDLGLH